MTMQGSTPPEFEDSDFVDTDFVDDFYDYDGNVSAGGLYDAGGHIIGERWADYADDIRDRMKGN